MKDCALLDKKNVTKGIRIEDKYKGAGYIQKTYDQMTPPKELVDLYNKKKKEKEQK